MTFITASRYRFTLAPLAVCLLLSACGGSPDSQAGPVAKPSLATLVTSGATPEARATTPERPLLRSDMSTADARRLFKVYNDCMAANGADLTKKTAPPAKTLAACSNKEPEEVFARAERLDPDYADEVRAWAKCITVGGVVTHVSKNNELRPEEEVPTLRYAKLMNLCQKQVFGQ